MEPAPGCQYPLSLTKPPPINIRIKKTYRPDGPGATLIAMPWRFQQVHSDSAIGLRFMTRAKNPLTQRQTDKQPGQSKSVHSFDHIPLTSGYSHLAFRSRSTWHEAPRRTADIKCLHPRQTLPEQETTRLNIT